MSGIIVVMTDVVVSLYGSEIVLHFRSLRFVHGEDQARFPNVNSM
jgi:hypothetical protein